MNFTKQDIIDFKSKKRYYLTFEKDLTPQNIKNIFYGERKISEIFSKAKIEYCNLYVYNIAYGDYTLGVKYINENGTFYMFIGANSHGAPPQEVAIGKSINGIIYFVCEQFPMYENYIGFCKIQEEYINKKVKGFIPKSYSNSITIFKSNIDMISDDITDNDIECVNIAYDGIIEFNNLIKIANV